MAAKFPFRPAGLLAALLLAAACGTDTRYAVPAVDTPTERVPSAFASLEVVEVTLPTYAASEDIYLQDAGGGLEPLGPLWADDPARAVTLQLSRDLQRITGALVAPDPWPFRDFPAARLDVRLEEFVATASGGFLIAGQYFVAPEEGGGDAAGRFAIEVPLAERESAAAIATARSAAVTRLATEIARAGLR
ncbi:PqiC family protein [Histidinibacterium aquaticum]|uniref:ABC-type transport auxiliary lipoprotein component domain-containing protein n=1 Tax=Histidinibacterium aquaticum TaxID=2613962 RepID=A0A5J5GHU5_9RHOB|nr:ABC-type transport auxiliary lipoprotein family protein [Histidinibacterium aquaticum]KAA9007809.1 hypothetical protein F3S47_09790 [Histidinibacterium aquaticum]